MKRFTRTAAAAAAAVMVAMAAVPASAETRVTLKSAQSGSSYYQMMVQLSEALKAGSNGDLVATVEESQGSVQNVKEAAKRPGNYLFTSPPSLIKQAAAGQKPFAEDPGYKDVRSLFTVPFVTMHWVVRADSGVKTLSDLAGKEFIPGGKGSFGQTKTQQVFTALGIIDQVKLVNVELDSAVPAVKNRQVVGFATAGSFPAPNVMELAAGTDIRLIGLTDADLAKIGDAGEVITIPANTYHGVTETVRTLSLPVGAYATTRMDEATAYAVVKAFWKQSEEMAKKTAWWKGVTTSTLPTLGAPLHPGALKYYAEAGINVPANLK